MMFRSSFYDRFVGGWGWGMYAFELENNDSDRNIVRVLSEDANGKESLVAIFFAVPDYVANTPEKPMIRLEERKSGAPEAVQSWFYPGNNTGWEFVYPKGPT